jgi:hypothetical protein
MTAGLYSFTIDQGSTFYLNLIYQDSAGVPVNLTGNTARMQLRRTFTSSVADLTLTTASGAIVITGATGNILITISDELTGTLEPGFYLYDLELDNGGIITRLIQGQVTLAQQVTLSA